MRDRVTEIWSIDEADRQAETEKGRETAKDMQGGSERDSNR